MSPTEVDRLDKSSNEAQVKAAISACIATEVHAGRDQEQAVAMCSEMARKRTGGVPSAPPEGGS